MTSNKDKLTEAIREALPNDAVPLLISVVGSQAKGLAGETSDYDVIAIVIYPMETYMLQRAPTTRKVNTEIDGVEVEVTCICIQQAL